MKKAKNQWNYQLVNSCIGISIVFSASTWKTLSRWHQRCGENQMGNRIHFTKAPLLTALRLTTMSTRTVLLIVDSRYEFITHLLLNDEMYGNSSWRASRTAQVNKVSTMKTTDFEDTVKELKERHMGLSVSAIPAKKSKSGLPFGIPLMEEAKDGPTLDLDSLLSEIDAKIAELEDKEENRKKKHTQKGKYQVRILDDRGNRIKVAWIIASTTGMHIDSATQELNNLPFNLSFDTKEEAIKFVKDITNAGGSAMIEIS